MNFDFKKPDFSFRKIVALLLAVVICAGQINVTALAKAVIREDGIPVTEGPYQEGDVSGDASGDASGKAALGETISIYASDILDEYVKIRAFDGENWTWMSVWDAFESGDIVIKLFNGEARLTIMDKDNSEYRMKVEEEDYNSNFYFQVLYKNQEIGKVNYSLNRRANWYAYGDCEDEDNYFSLLPGESALLKVALSQRGGTESVDFSSFTYQWQKMNNSYEFEDIEGATNDNYVVGYDNEGNYRCVVTDESGYKEQVCFYVNKNNGLIASIVGNSRSYLKSGETVVLQVEAYSKIGGVTITGYKWFRESNEIEGETGNSISVKETGSYGCRVTDSNDNSIEVYFDVFESYKLDENYASLSNELKVNQSVDVNTKADTYCFYAITPKATGMYSFYSEGDNDPLAYVLDSDGYILQYDDDGATGNNFRINMQLTGGYTYYLAVKGYDDDVFTVKVSAACADHTKTVLRNEKAATCTEAGYTGDTFCANCGELVKSGSSIPAKGHSYGAWNTTKESDVLTAGTEERSCSVCGEKETRSIEKLGATISVNYKSIPLAVKQSTTAVKVSYGKGDGIASWKSSNTKIATVSKAGKITGKKAGTAKIIVTLKSGKKATITVKVQKSAVATTKVTVQDKKVAIKKGKTAQIKATVTPVTSKQKVTYTSSNKKVATVSSKGKITGKKKGTATITVKSGKKSAKVKVTVK